MIKEEAWDVACPPSLKPDGHAFGFQILFGLADGIFAVVEDRGGKYSVCLASRKSFI